MSISPQYDLQVASTSVLGTIHLPGRSESSRFKHSGYYTCTSKNLVPDINPCESSSMTSMYVCFDLGRSAPWLRRCDISALQLLGAASIVLLHISIFDSGIQGLDTLMDSSFPLSWGTNLVWSVLLLDSIIENRYTYTNNYNPLNGSIEEIDINMGSEPSQRAFLFFSLQNDAFPAKVS
jgi:hypothetical protein